MTARHPQRGQAAVEFVALVLLACIALGALVSVGSGADGRAAGGFLVHHIVCAIGGRCHDDERELVRAYGERDAATIRALAPHLVYEPGERQLPVDWRRCRHPDCAVAPDDPTLDVHTTDSGHRATAFTRLIRRDGRLYVGYWLYYPDSNTALAGSDRLWERSWLLPRMRDLVSGTPGYPGYHRDDWEGAFVRLDPDGSAWIRASSHGRFNGCEWSGCRESWLQGARWVRISRGSHSGHVPVRTEMPRRPTAPPYPRYIPLPGPAVRDRRRVPLVPGRDLRERTTTGEGLRLVPLETLDRRRYRPLDPGVRPPWRKRAYTDPESDES